MSVKALIYQCFKTTFKNAHNSWPYISGDRHHDFVAIKIFLASLLHQRAHMFFANMKASSKIVNIQCISRCKIAYIQRDIQNN